MTQPVFWKRRQASIITHQPSAISHLPSAICHHPSPLAPRCELTDIIMPVTSVKRSRRASCNHGTILYLFGLENDENDENHQNHQNHQAYLIRDSSLTFHSSMQQRLARLVHVSNGTPEDQRNNTLQSPPTTRFLSNSRAVSYA